MAPKTLLIPVLAAAAASAQQTLWGQCGGIGWTGPTTCVSGSVCIKQNDYYSQCIPASTTTSAATTVRTSTTSAPTATATVPAGVKYFITFGDSYSQTGFDPAGQLATSSNPLGNPTLPGWTSSGGLNWIGDLITKYNSSLTFSYNFAYGGATTNASLVAPYTPTVLSFIDQVTQYSGSIAKKPAAAPWTSSNSLFGVWMGVNDIGGAWYTSNPTQLISAIFDDYFEQVEILYQSGARNFVFLNVPPTDRSPYVISLGADAVKGLAAGIVQWNTQIATRVSQFTSSHSGVSATLVDTQKPFNDLLNSGGSKSTCYNSDNVSCLWYNDYHPGIVIQDAVAKAVAAALPSFFKV